MLTNEKFNTAHAMAANNDKASPVIIEYITMPKAIRDRVAIQVYNAMIDSGLSLEDYVLMHYAELDDLAERNTMSLTTLIAFVLDILEEEEKAEKDTGEVPGSETTENA